MDPFVQIASGVALILFGVRFLRKGLIRWLGKGLDSRLAGWMKNGIGAAASGFIFGTFAPSSTTQSILAVNLLKNKKIDPANVLSFLLWANAGITVTVQLISLKITSFYPLFLLLGVAGFQFSKNQRVRAVGQCLLAFGLIFLSMSTISSAAAQLSSGGDFAEVVKIAGRHPWMMIVFVAVCTFSLQSSMAVMGITFALANATLLPLSGVLSAVLGTSLGIGLTTLFAGWGDPRTRLLAISGLLVKGGILTIAALLLPNLESWLGLSSLPPQTVGAMTHTVLYLSTALVGTLLSPLLSPWLRKFDNEPNFHENTISLDPSLLSAPRLALACASREAVKMGDRVAAMYTQAWEAFDNSSPVLAKLCASNLPLVSRMEEEINSYVGSLDWEGMSRSDRELSFGIMNFASQLEGVADVVAKNIVATVVANRSRLAQLSQDELTDLRKIRELVGRRLNSSTAVLASRDPILAASFLEEGETLKKFTIEVLKNTYQKMGFGHDHVVTSAYLDLVRSLRRISGQLNTIGHTFSPSSLQQAEAGHGDDPV
jgi:phosphate:Na+ symporter